MAEPQARVSFTPECRCALPGGWPDQNIRDRQCRTFDTMEALIADLNDGETDMAEKKPILCLDFDGVLHSYTSGWCGPRTMPDPPVEGMRNFLAQAVKHFEVHVFSSRSRYWGGRAAMKRWLYRWMVSGANHPLYWDDILAELRFPRTKPPAMVTLDDRALTFTGVFPNPKDLLEFKPWNKKRRNNANA